MSHVGAPAPSQTLNHGGDIGGDLAFPPIEETSDFSLSSEEDGHDDKDKEVSEVPDEDYLEGRERYGYLVRDPVIEPYFKKDTDVNLVWSTRESS